MHLTTLRERILDYLHHLSVYDYIAYGWLVAVLVGSLLLAIVLAGKKPKTSLLLILIVLVSMMAGPFGMKYALDRIVRKTALTDTNTTHLQFAKDLIVTGKIVNEGKIDFSGCRVFVTVLKKDENRYRQMLYMLKPLRKKSLHIEKRLPKGEEMAYRVVLEHFALREGTYDVRQRVECY